MWYVGSKDGPVLPSMSHIPFQCAFTAPSSAKWSLFLHPLESQLTLWLFWPIKCGKSAVVWLLSPGLESLNTYHSHTLEKWLSLWKRKTDYPAKKWETIWRRTKHPSQKSQLIACEWSQACGWIHLRTSIPIWGVMTIPTKVTTSKTSRRTTQPSQAKPMF